jgi:hypothetical protein
MSEQSYLVISKAGFDALFQIGKRVRGIRFTPGQPPCEEAINSVVESVHRINDKIAADTFAITFSSGTTTTVIVVNDPYTN